MNALDKSLQFTIPLSFTAHSQADRFRQQQASATKAEQVYLNTLAVFAVDVYLRCLGVETDINKGDSHNPLCLKFMNVADLWIKDIGYLECRPIASNATAMSIPEEVREDRVGYVAVELDQALKQATLVGFTETAAAEVPLSQLKAIADFPEYLHQIQQTPSAVIDLKQWLTTLKQEFHLPVNGGLDSLIESGWQTLESLFSPNELKPTFSMRSSLLERGKQICLATQVTQKTVVLVVRLDPKSEQETNIIVEVRPQSGQRYLPEALQVKILDDQKTAVMQATASSTNQNIQFDFEARSGEHFSIQMTLGDVSAIEAFVV